MKDFGTKGILESDDTHIEDILLMGKGHSKFVPQFGVEIKRYIKSRAKPIALLQDVRTNIENDGAKIKTLSFENDTLTLDVTY